jgi:nucleotide-binding universal stress UspA family protein
MGGLVLVKRQRVSLVVLLSVLAHASLLVLLLRTPVTSPAGTGRGAMSVSLYDGKALMARAAPPSPPRPQATPPASTTREQRPKPVLPPDVAPQYVNVEPPADEVRLNADPAQDPVAVAVAVAAASSAPGHACRMGAWLQAALQADPAVGQALAAIPRANRSVANAIMLWDVRWVSQPAPAVAGVSAIRSALMVGVRAAPAECQAQLVRGPELITLADASGATVIAVGSGEWRWGDLLTQDTLETAVRQTDF